MKRPNFLAKTANVSLLCGSVILTMIAATILTSQLIFAETKTVLLVGEGALAMRTIGVSPSGCSATARTIAAMDQTNSTKIVHLVKKRAISDAETGVASPSE